MTGIDRSERIVSIARQDVTDERVRFETGDATDIRLDSAARDVTVSGLVLNFVSDHNTVVQEIACVTEPGGKVSAYVWDYAGGMEIARRLWDAALS